MNATARAALDALAALAEAPITREHVRCLPTVEIERNTYGGSRNYAGWSRRAPLTCGTCGAVSNFPCHHQRAASAPHVGDHVSVQLAEASFGATIRVIQGGPLGGIADVEPDDAPGTVLTVTFGTGEASQITPMGSAA